MKKYLYLLFAIFVAVGLSACSTDSNEPDGPQTEVPTPTPDPGPTPDPDPATGKTLIVYYSFTNNVHTIVSDLQTQIEADVVRVEPAEEGLDYAANNYAIGNALIQAIRNHNGYRQGVQMRHKADDQCARCECDKCTGAVKQPA